VSAFLGEFAARSIKLHHPHYMGHQVCAPLPTAALAGLAAELLNNGMAVYEMGQAATALERWIVRQACDALGLTPGDGFLTSGGTLAEDGTTRTGSVFIINVPSREAAEKFSAEEPFRKAGLFRTVKITRMRRGQWNPEAAPKSAEGN